MLICRGQACIQQKTRKPRVMNSNIIKPNQTNCYSDARPAETTPSKRRHKTKLAPEKFKRVISQNGGLDDFQDFVDSCIRGFYVCPDVRPGVRESVQTSWARDKRSEIDGF